MQTKFCRMKSGVKLDRGRCVRLPQTLRKSWENHACLSRGPTPGESWPKPLKTWGAMGGHRAVGNGEGRHSEAAVGRGADRRCSVNCQRLPLDCCASVATQRVLSSGCLIFTLVTEIRFTFRYNGDVYALIRRKMAMKHTCHETTGDRGWISYLELNTRHLIQTHMFKSWRISL